MKTIIMALALIFAGCGTMQPIINGAAATVVTNIKSAEDANISLWKLNVCGTPYSAIIRHPEIVPAVRALCLPNGDQANPATLLNEVKQP